MATFNNVGRLGSISLVSLLRNKPERRSGVRDGVNYYHHFFRITVSHVYRMWKNMHHALCHPCFRRFYHMFHSHIVGGEVVLQFLSSWLP